MGIYAVWPLFGFYETAACISPLNGFLAAKPASLSVSPSFQQLVECSLNTATHASEYMLLVVLPAASQELPGLYLCGEVLDVFGRIGGFNFWWAWLSGRLAGTAAGAAAAATEAAAGKLQRV
jgi:hypothetical protein